MSKSIGRAKAAKPAPASEAVRKTKRQWREFETENGGRPVKTFIDDLDDEAHASVVAAMREVREEGIAAAKHLRGDIYEVVADSKDKWIRILFAQQGKFSQVLLSLNAFEKKTNKTPPKEIDLAETRLASWIDRGRKLKKAEKKR